MSKSRGKKRKRMSNRPLLRKLKKKVTREGPFKDWEVVYNPEEEAKMSEIILDFVTPYLPEMETEEEQGKLIALAVVAWNAALMPEEERDGAVAKILDEAIPAAIRSDVKSFVNELVERKNVYFGGIKRYIIDYQMVDTGEGMHLTVASTLTEI